MGRGRAGGVFCGGFFGEGVGWWVVFPEKGFLQVGVFVFRKIKKKLRNI